MDQTRRTVILTGVGIVLGSAVLGYGAGLLVERLSGPPLKYATTPSASPTTPAAPVAPTLEPVAAATSPSPAPSAPPTPLPPVQLTIESVPASARVGEPVVVRWQIRGPAGFTGASTRLVVTGERAPQVVSAAVTSFALPARYEVSVKITASGTLTLTAEAVVNGQVLRATQQLEVQ